MSVIFSSTLLAVIVRVGGERKSCHGWATFYHVCLSLFRLITHTNYRERKRYTISSLFLFPSMNNGYRSRDHLWKRKNHPPLHHHRQSLIFCRHFRPVFPMTVFLFSFHWWVLFIFLSHPLPSNPCVNPVSTHPVVGVDQLHHLCSLFIFAFISI